MRPRRRLLARLGRAGLLVVIGLILAVGAAELMVGAWASWRYPPLYRLDDRLGWTHTPGVDRGMPNETGERVRFAIDERGFRATPHELRRTPGRARVVCLGDSFTEGAQVPDDELFTSRIERELDAVEVWNVGVGGWGTVQELLWLQDHGNAVSPDLVVLVVYENDLIDNLMPYFGGLGPRPYARTDATTVELVERIDSAPFEPFLMPAPARFWLYERSWLYRSLHKNLFLRRRGKELAAYEERERNAQPVAAQQLVMEALLGRMADAARGLGHRLLVAAIPTRADAIAGHAASHAWIGAHCARLGVPFVSLVQALHEAPAGDGYFVNDIHLTRTGHARVARALVDPVRDRLR